MTYEEQAKKLKKELDEQIGDQTRQTLLDLIEVIKKVTLLTPKEKQEELQALYDKVSQLTETKTDTLIEAVKELSTITKGIKLELPEKLKVLVENQPEYPTEIKVSNLKDPLPYPTEVALKKPAWLEQITTRDLSSAVHDVIRAVEGTKVDLEKYREPKNALAVRLVDKKGQNFYEALLAVTGGGGSASFPFETSNNVATPALVDEEGYILPGSGASNIGKAEDAVHASGDIGVMALGIFKKEPVQLAGEGKYSSFLTDISGRLHSNVEHDTILDAMNATAGWAVLGDDTTNLATTTNHVHGTNALEFDKANGTDNTIFAGIEKTISSVDITDHSNHGVVQVPFYVSSTAQVAYIFVRIGTDSSNYNEWRIDDDDITGGAWEPGAININFPDVNGSTGNGWNPAAVTYIAVGVAFDNQINTLEDIRFDEIAVHSSLHTLASISSEVSTSINTPNVKLQSYGNAVDTNAGNVSNQTLRTVLATNQLPVATKHSVTDIADGVKTVSSAGDDEALAGSTAAKEVTIQAQTDNTSLIAVGATGVDATVATGTGIILYAGDSITLKCDNLADIFIDSLVNGEGVRFTYLT